MGHINLSFRRTPFVRPALCYILGLVGAIYFDINSYYCYLTLFICFLAMTVSYILSFTSLFGFSFLASCSIIAYLQLHQLNTQSLNNNIKAVENQELGFKGIIVDKVFKTAKGDKLKIPLSLRSMSSLNDSQHMTLTTELNVIAFIDLAKNKLEKLSIGDELMLTGRLTTIAENPNPHAFNYKQYMFNKGYGGFLYVSGIQLIQKENFSIKAYFINIQERLASILKEHICDQDAYTIAAAMVLGHKDDLSDNIQDIYRKTGSAHIIAVSGLHIDIISVIILMLLGKNKVANIYLKMLQFLLLIILVWSYALLVGSTASVVRASTMFTLGIIARASSHRVNIWNILSLTALIMLAYNPRYIFDISFQFSFLGIISIVYFFPKLRYFNLFKTKLIRYWFDIILVSIAVQILIAPLSIYYFNYFPLGFLVSNAVLFVFIYLIICGSFSVIGSSFLYDSMTSFLANILEQIITVLNAFLSFVSKIHFLGIDNIHLTLSDLIIIYGYLSLFIVLQKKLNLWRLKLIAVIISLHLSYTIYCQQTKFFEARIVVYHCPNNNLIDFIHQNTCYAYSTNNKPYPYNTYSNRIASDIDKVIDLSGHSFEDKHLRKFGHVIEFFEHKILLEFEDQYENIEDFNLIIGKANYSPDSISNHTIILNTKRQQHEQTHNTYIDGPLIRNLK